MPLIPAVFGQNLEQVFSNLSSSSFPNAKNFANESVSFIDMGLTAAGGAPSASGFGSKLALDIADIWDGQLPAAISGKKTAMAISDVLKQTPTAGGAHGTGTLLLDDPFSFGQEIGDIYESKLPVSIMTKKYSMAKKTYLSNAPFQGSGIPPAFIPDISPLS